MDTLHTYVRVELSFINADDISVSPAFAKLRELLNSYSFFFYSKPKLKVKMR